MESYQTAGVIISILGILLSFAVGIFIPPLGVLMFFVNIVTLILSAVVKTNTRGLGVALIVLGIIGNVFLIIPGIMAIRYKPSRFTV